MKNILRVYGALLVICLSIFACGDVKEIPKELPLVNDDGGDPDPEPEVELFIPDNCSNPPTEITFNDGFLCKASETRNETIVCVLPYQFTWPPYIDKNDGRNTFRCNANDETFDDVKIFLRNGEVISLDYAGCHNPVFLNGFKQGRIHVRDESRKWNSSIARRAERIEMTKGNKKTCLKF